MLGKTPSGPLRSIPQSVCLGNALGRGVSLESMKQAEGRFLVPWCIPPSYLPLSKADWLRANGANDSKQLTEERRVAFFDVLLTTEDLGWRARVLHPEYISNCMLRHEKYNLNELSYDAVFGLIESLLAEQVLITEAFVDTLGEPEKYQALLTNKFPAIKFTVRSKADALFPVVGAASMVAKVLRDDILRAWGIEASGYPGDAATVAWLRDNVDRVFGFPNVVRFSWSSCAGLLDERCVKIIWCDEDEGENGEQQGEHQEGPLHTGEGAQLLSLWTDVKDLPCITAVIYHCARL